MENCFRPQSQKCYLLTRILTFFDTWCKTKTKSLNIDIYIHIKFLLAWFFIICVLFKKKIIRKNGHFFCFIRYYSIEEYLTVCAQGTAHVLYYSFPKYSYWAVEGKDLQKEEPLCIKLKLLTMWLELGSFPVLYYILYYTNNGIMGEYSRIGTMRFR